MRCIRLIVGSGLAILVILNAVAEAQEQATYKLASGEQGGSEHRMAEALADLADKVLSPVGGGSIVVVPTSGFLESFTLLVGGKVQLALLSTDWQRQATAIGPSYRSIARLGQNGLQSTMLLAQESLDRDAVYDLTRMIFENQDYLRSVEPLFLELSLAGEEDDLAVPAHSGVDRFHAEQLRTNATAPDLGPEPPPTGGPITALPPASKADRPAPVPPGGHRPIM
ncbi:MAG: hypothetical protein HC871_00535 [Rhizobiales bacterium]|nr:hypothetical protein [Hyphomicrobiales bacterium]